MTKTRYNRATGYYNPRKVKEDMNTASMPKSQYL
jgi:hypothetical protein